MEYVERKHYLDRISPFIGNGNAKVITGMRRCGKSTLMGSLADGFDTDTNIVYIDMELWSNRKFHNPDVLYDHISSSFKQGFPNVLMIDEVQDIDGWESIIRSVIAESTYDVFITGSNSKLLSGEYATFLSGRLNTVDMGTLTLSECLDFEKTYRNEADADEILKKMLHVGGFPSIWKHGYAEADALSELRDILQAILMRDIVARYDVKKPDLLMRILRFICDNTGNITSVNNMYNVLSNEEHGLSTNTVYGYVGHLEAACLIHKVETYDIKGKRILTSKYKYYLSDVGLKNALMGYRPDDIAGYVENIIYLELKSRGYKVWVGGTEKGEVDFIAESGGDAVYVQATVRLTDESVVKREFGSLLKIRDNHPKYVVTLEDGPLNADIDGIKCMTLKDFLLLDRY